MAEQDSDRSEQATPHRLEEARKKGQVAKSVDFLSCAAIAVLTVVGPSSLFHADENGPAAQRLLSASHAVSWRLGFEPAVSAT